MACELLSVVPPRWALTLSGVSLCSSPQSYSWPDPYDGTSAALTLVRDADGGGTETWNLNGTYILGALGDCVWRGWSAAGGVVTDGDGNVLIHPREGGPASWRAWVARPMGRYQRFSGAGGAGDVTQDVLGNVELRVWVWRDGPGDPVQVLVAAWFVGRSAIGGLYGVELFHSGAVEVGAAPADLTTLGAIVNDLTSCGRSEVPGWGYDPLAPHWYGEAENYRDVWATGGTASLAAVWDTWGGVLAVRAGDTAGRILYAETHAAVAVGTTVDVSWVGGGRTGMSVTGSEDYAGRPPYVELSGGTGDGLPASGTTVAIMVHT